MPKEIKPFSDLQVRRLKRAGLHAVGGVPGLYLCIGKSGSRSWILRAVVGAKRRDIGLGGYPGVTLSQARDAARQARQLIREGIDPAEHRQEAKKRLIASQNKSITFRKAAEGKHADIVHEFRNAQHGKEWLRSLENHAYPAIGDMYVSDIELPDVLAVLKPIWHTKTETASRVRQRIEAVLAWSIVRKYREGGNPATWEGNLKEVLPAAAKIKKVQHHKSLHWRDMPEFMQALTSRNGVSARALEFAILTAARSGEVRGMTWAELDLEACLWIVPPERIKAGKRHTIPLSAEALNIVKNRPHMLGSELVFPSNQGTMLSATTLLSVCKRMKVKATPHGFRSSFKDWARNATNYPDEVSELALAHVDSDATRAAYARDGLLSKRTELLQAWADYCYTPVQEVVGKIKEAA